MNQKAFIHIEVSRESRNYNFEMPWGASYQECYDVAIEIANKIVEISKEAQEREEKLKAEQASPEAQVEAVEEPQGV